MKLNHVLVRTTDLNAMSRFWTEVIGLEQGYRPPFPFRGAWFYSYNQALVHVAEDRSVDPCAGPIVHVALEGADYDDLIATLKQRDVAYDEKDVPLSGERQVFVIGPDGLMVEMLFSLGEGDGKPYPYEGVRT